MSRDDRHCDPEEMAGMPKRLAGQAEKRGEGLAQDWPKGAALTGQPGEFVGAGYLIELGQFVVIRRGKSALPSRCDADMAGCADAGATTFGLHRKSMGAHEFDEVEA